MVKLTKVQTDGIGSNWTISQSELDRLIKEHRGTIDDVIVTPAMATYILKHYNSGNRRLRIGHANTFEQILTRGKWQNTGEAVIFSSEGILNNGQHRLEGIARSGISAIMDIRFGIPRAAFAVTDTGSKRQAGDVLSISGSTSPFSSAAAIKLLLAYEKGLPANYNARAGNDEILESFKRWNGIEQAVDLNHRLLNRKGFLNAASNAFTFMALRQNEKSTHEFLSLVESGLTGDKNDPPRQLRERLLADVQLQKGSRTSVIERFALFIKAWNLWNDNKHVKVLRWRFNEPFPVMKIKL